MSDSRQERAELHMPDRMGVWSDYGPVWLPKRDYATRGAAKQMMARETGLDFLDARVRSRFMRHAPEHESALAFDGEFYVVCEADEPGAFPVWEIE